MRKLVVWVAFGLLLPCLCLPARAASGEGSIRVIVRSGGEPVSGCAVTLFRVGIPCEEGYRIVDSFGGGMVREADALSPHLAQWLAQMEGEPGLSRILDADGCARFRGLEEGLYLLLQSGGSGDYFPIQPFLMKLPYEGQWDVDAYPFTQLLYTDTENPRTGQHPAPILGAIGMVISGIGLAICAGRKRKQ